MASPFARLDKIAGDAVESVVAAHHRRRLRRLGWAAALEPAGEALWTAGEPAPRSRCSLEVLVDGSEALPRIAADLERAESSVLVAGWHFGPAFQLRPGGQTLRELLADIAERADVRVIAWAGAPLPLFTPSRRDARSMRDALARGTRIRMALDSLERPMHCHHEKAIVIDDKVAYVGGIDLTTLAGNRWDTPHHAARGELGWHDATVRIEGPLLGDVWSHLALRWHEVTGERLHPGPLGEPRGEHEAQLVRTVPEKIYGALPRGEFQIAEAYVRALGSAQTLVYLENQFLWSPEIVPILEEKLRRPPTDEFRVVVLLPVKANNGSDDTRGQLARLVSADVDDRLLACTLYQPGLGEPVYVHAKIGIVDDRWLTVGSANLNEHSLFNDTELNVVTCDEELVRGTRMQLWREHLGRDDVGGPAHVVVDEMWKPVADEQLDRRSRGVPLTHRLLRLPDVSRRSEALLGPLNGLIVDG
jgi:phosphatidylserine/phosphatidylglycerophosphate/cardiolipin synthase-like enzyme